jgi:hypothetical protein
MTEVVENEVVETQDVDSAVETTEENAPAPELTLNDLAVLRQIIEVASQRGAFKAAELESVGKAFNKLSAFLESVAASQKG